MLTPRKRVPGTSWLAYFGCGGGRGILITLYMNQTPVPQAVARYFSDGCPCLGHSLECSGILICVCCHRVHCSIYK